MENLFTINVCDANEAILQIMVVTYSEDIVLVLCSSETSFGHLWNYQNSIDSDQRHGKQLRAIFLIASLPVLPTIAPIPCKTEISLGHLKPTNLVDDPLLASAGFTHDFFDDLRGRDVAVFDLIKHKPLADLASSMGITITRTITPTTGTVIMDVSDLQKFKKANGIRALVDRGVKLWLYGIRPKTLQLLPWGPTPIFTLHGAIITFTPTVLSSNPTGCLELAKLVHKSQNGWKCYILPQTLIWLDNSIKSGKFSVLHCQYLMEMVRYLDVRFVMLVAPQDAIRRFDGCQKLASAGDWITLVQAAKDYADLGFTIGEQHQLETSSPEVSMKLLERKQLQDLAYRGNLMVDCSFPRIIAAGPTKAELQEQHGQESVEHLDFGVVRTLLLQGAGGERAWSESLGNWLK